ncbi:MAG: OmpH family outer membrane protein [Culturomica sp.]|jgi:outer membrane protein|nr:OmpH family outer membrane protein [Culturomica sp.]
MKKFLIFVFLSSVAFYCQAQTRIGYVDMEYILNNIPDYTKAKEELNVYSLKLQGEVDELYKQITEAQSKYNSEKVFLTPVMREKREKDIAEQENKARLLQEKYFGPKGDLSAKREELFKPILDEINEVIKDIAKEGNFAAIQDISVSRSILYFDPKLDRSTTVLRKMGYTPEKEEK